MKQGDDYQLEGQIGFLLRRAHQYASGIFQEQMSVLALTPPQFSTLVKIREQGTVSQNRLGRLIDTDPATMQGIVKRLADRGYIERLPDKDHKRKINLHLTETGREQIDAAVVIAVQITADTLGALDASERVQLTQLLAKLVGAREKLPVSGGPTS